MKKHGSRLALISIAMIPLVLLLRSPQLAVQANSLQGCYSKPCPTPIPGGGSAGKRKRPTATSIPPTETPTSTSTATVTPSPTSTETLTPAPTAVIASTSSGLLAPAIPSPSRTPVPVVAGLARMSVALPVAGALLALALAALAAFWLKYSLFLPDGKPTRATVHVAMKQPGNASDTSQSDSSSDEDTDGKGS